QTLTRGGVGRAARPRRGGAGPRARRRRRAEPARAGPGIGARAPDRRGAAVAGPPRAGAPRRAGPAAPRRPRAAPARRARAGGCGREVFDADTVGPLPHLDLDATPGPSGTSAPARPATTPLASLGLAAGASGTWMAVMATGCRLSLSARTGRPGAERLRAAF